LRQLFRNSGFNLEIHQITNGRLFGWFDVRQVGAALHLVISSNQALIFLGQPSKNYLNFSIEKGHAGEYTKAQGLEIGGPAITGFATKKDEIFFSTSPGSLVHHLCVPKALIVDLVSRLYGVQGLIFMDQNNTCQLSEKSHKRLAAITDEARLMPGNQTQTRLFVEILDAIFQKDVTLRESSESVELVKNFVRHAARFGGPKALTVADVAAQLYTSKTTLSERLKKLTGVSPSAFLEIAHLEQAHMALMNPLDDRSVSQIAKDFGLGSRFSAKYLKKYGESPSTTKFGSRPRQLVAPGLWNSEFLDLF